jgi:4-hydroxy-2-oxoheptanedioate aldolase
LEDAIDRIKEAAHGEGKKVGIYCTGGEQARVFAERGFDMVSVAADMIVVPQGFAEALVTAKGGEGKTKTRGGGYDGR